MSFNTATYTARNTPVHRIDARVKILVMLAYSVTIFLVHFWAGLGVLAAAFLATSAAARLNLLRAVRQFAPMGFILAATLLANWYAIGVGFTLQGFLQGLFYVVRIVLMVGASLVLTSTTSSTQITRALESFMAPLARLRVPTRDIATIVSIALRFIPITVNQFQQVRAAQAARGASFDTGRLFARLRSWATVLVPLFVGMYRRADNLASALDARGYGLAAPTHLEQSAFGPSAAIALAAGMAFCLVVAVVF